MDPHVDKPLGEILTTRQMTLRDRLVFKVAREMGLKVCVSLAGGYQVDADGGISKLLELHDTTFSDGWNAYDKIS